MVSAEICSASRMNGRFINSDEVTRLSRWVKESFNARAGLAAYIKNGQRASETGRVRRRKRLRKRGQTCWAHFHFQENKESRKEGIRKVNELEETCLVLVRQATFKLEWCGVCESMLSSGEDGSYN